jgi:hypothetical protein
MENATGWSTAASNVHDAGSEVIVVSPTLSTLILSAKEVPTLTGCFAEFHRFASISTAGEPIATPAEEAVIAAVSE